MNKEYISDFCFLYVKNYLSLEGTTYYSFKYILDVV